MFATRLRRTLLVSLLLLALLARSPALWLLVALVLLAAGASALWERYCLAGVSYARRLSAERAFCGEQLDLWVELTNAKPLPLAWLKAEDELPADFTLERGTLTRSSDPQRQLLTNLLSLRWYERVRRHYRITAQRRGLYAFGPAVLSSGDIFGLRTRYLDLSAQQPLLVYPRLVPLADLQLKPARPYGDRRTARRISEDPLRLAGTRDYQPGDSVRHIHWKATARRGTLQTKIFEPNAAHALVLFMNGNMLNQAQMTDVFETSVTVSASLAHAALELRYAVGFFTNGSLQDSGQRVRVPVSRHAAQSQRLLETFARLTYFSFTPFAGLLEIERPLLPYGATVIAVTPVADEAVLTRLLDLHEAGHPVALVIIGAERPLELLPPELPAYFVAADWRQMTRLELRSTPYSPSPFRSPHSPPSGEQAAQADRWARGTGGT